MKSSPKLPLEGVRVLDLSRVLAGPFATQQLLDLGAEVIKVEQPGTGDPTRAWGPPFTKDGRSAYYLFCNRGKKSIAINLHSQAGQNLIRKMSRKVDVLIESFRPGHLKSLGLDLAGLRKENPKLVTCSISAFGHTGPRKDEGGYDALIQAMSGIMSITGPESGPPSKVGVAVVDIAAGLFASNAMLGCLLGRAIHKSKAPRHVEVSLYDVALALLANVASSVLLTGKDAERYGNAHATVVPYQPFQAKDGALLLAVGSDGQWKLLAETLQRKDWLRNKTWAKNAGRIRDRKKLIQAVAQELKKHPRAKLVAKLKARGIPVGYLQSVKEALNEDVVRARKLILRHKDGTKSVASPMRVLDQTQPTPAPAPQVGEHTTRVLKTFGFSPKTISHLFQHHIVS